MELVIRKVIKDYKMSFLKLKYLFRNVHFTIFHSLRSFILSDVGIIPTSFFIYKKDFSKKFMFNWKSIDKIT